MDKTSKIQQATADNREFTQRSTLEGFDNGVRDWKKLGRRPHTVDCQVTLRNNILFSGRRSVLLARNA